MQDCIKRALNGDSAALRELFDANWRDAAALCRLTNANEEEANRVLEKAFGDSWDYLLDCGCDSEETFRRYLLKHTAVLCRKTYQKAGAKTLPLPPNRNFLITGKITVPQENASAMDILAASMPGIQRFIFAMHRVCGMDTKAIMSVTGYKENILEAAMDAETKNLNLLLNQIENATGLHTEPEDEIQRYKDALQLPQELQDSIFARIEKITAPFRKKAKKKKLLIGGAIAAAAVIILLCCASLLGIGEKKAEEPEEAAETAEETELAEEEPAEATETDVSEAEEVCYADIEIENYGTVTVKLDREAAPITVENFISLAESGFYDGLTFHRIMDGFMMQGGDPNGDGTGGSENTIIGEFSENGYENPISHIRGTISMARSNDYDSASSQFFIVQEDSTFLDGQYAAFGSVTEGMEIVDAICEAAEPTDDNGTIPAENQPVIISITIREEGAGDEA